MFKFSREQSIVNIANVKLGGQPGELPTVLCGTIFYQGQKIVKDEELGLFDSNLALALVNRQAELSEETGNPAVLHIYARTALAFERYLEFLDEIWKGPFIIDSAEPQVRSSAAKLVSELGYADRAIYNSISLATSEKEMEALEGSEVDSAVILAYNPTDCSVDGSLKALETGGPLKERGLIDLARDLGMANLLIDPGVMPLGSGGGSALRFSVAAKARLGLPVGSGIHNAISAWPWLRDKGALNRKCCDASAAAMQLLSAGDFLLYGPIENADFIFPVAAMADIMISEAVRDLKIWPAPGHPIHKLV